MRWFTDAFYDVDTDDEAQDRISADYYAHVRRILPVLPPDLARLASDPALDLHDAHFERVEIDLDSSTTTIVVIAGNLQFGYRRMTMVFTGSTIVPLDLRRLGYAVTAEFRPSDQRQRRGVTEILDQEVDVLPDGRYTLRLRLWPFHEFAVDFDELALTESVVDDRGRAKGGSFEIRGTLES